MQVLDAKSHITSFSINDVPAGVFHLKTQYGYDLDKTDAGHYLFSAVSASVFTFMNDSELHFAADVAIILAGDKKPQIDELLELTNEARNEMNRLLDLELLKQDLGIMQIAAINMEETRSLLQAALDKV